MKDENGYIDNLEGEVAILKNQLSAFATELANKRVAVGNLHRELENKMQRLDAAKKKFKATQHRLEKEKSSQDNLESANMGAEDGFKEADTMMHSVQKDMDSQKEELVKQTKSLFKLREEQANLIGQISGCLSASRNLQANINNLKQQAQRQQELLYNAEFQIQQMARRVARA